MLYWDLLELTSASLIVISAPAHQLAVVVVAAAAAAAAAAVVVVVVADIHVEPCRDAFPLLCQSAFVASVQQCVHCHFQTPQV